MHFLQERCVVQWNLPCRAGNPLKVEVEFYCSKIVTLRICEGMRETDFHMHSLILVPGTKQQKKFKNVFVRNGRFL